MKETTTRKLRNFQPQFSKQLIVIILFCILAPLSSSAQAPSAPIAIAAGNYTCTSFNANWNASACATSYYIDVATDAAFSSLLMSYNNLNVGNVTTYTIAGLMPNVIYYYRVRAGNDNGSSGNSNTISVGTTTPPAPVAIAADNFTCTSFNANWAASTCALFYYIDVSTSASFATSLWGYNSLNVGNVTTYNVTGLMSNATYYYRVRAGNGITASGNSNTIVAGTTAPVAPVAAACTNLACTSFNANWGAVSGVTAYYLDVSTSLTFNTFVTNYNNLNVSNVTTYNVSGLDSNVTYYYRVRAGNGCSTSLNSNTVSVQTCNAAIAAPTSTAASNTNCASFDANWAVVYGATGYFLDVSTNAAFTSNSFVGVYNNLYTGNLTTYSINGLTPGTTYYYRLRATDGSTTSLNSNTIIAATTMVCTQVTPTATDPTSITCTSFNANWNAVSGTINYFLDVSTDANFSTFISIYNNLNIGNVSSYNVTGLTSGSTYYYRVRADDGSTVSSNSNAITVNMIPVAPIAAAASNLTCTSFNANWGASAGATTYFIDVSTDINFTTTFFAYNNQNTGNVTTFYISGLSAGTTYYYRLRAGNGCATSSNSNTIAITPCSSTPDAPVATGASNLACTSFNANWTVSSGAIAYYLDVSTDASFSSFVLNNLNVGNVFTYNVTGLTPGTTYYYRVRADNGSATSLNSNTIAIIPSAITAPLATAADNFTCTSASANWGAVAGAINYFLDIATDISFAPGSILPAYNNLATANVTSYNITGLSYNTTYYYRVRVNNDCDTSVYSNTISFGTVDPIAPTAMSACNITCNSFMANWAVSSGATSYHIDISTDAAFTTFVSGFNDTLVGNITTLVVTGLITNTTYYYRVRADNGCGISSSSNSISVITSASCQLSAPVATAATNTTCTSFNANWNAVSGAVTYYLDVSTDASFTTFVTPYNDFIVGNVTTYNVTGLSTNTIYYYRVRVNDGSTTSSNSNTIIYDNSPVAPTATAASGITCTSFNANWSAVSGATSYTIDVSTSASFSSFVPGYNDLNVGNITTYNVTGLTVGITYYYRVRATNSCSTSLSSNMIVVSIYPPVAPVATAGTIPTCVSFNANWSAVSGATSYTIDVSTSASFTSFVVGYNNLNVGNVLTYNITGLTAGTIYYYRVRASNACATSSNSTTIIVATTSTGCAITAPVADSASSVTCTSFIANWNTVAGATEYYLDVSTDASFSSFLSGYNNLNVGNVSTYPVTGLTANVTYYYRLRASDGSTTSSNSNTIAVSVDNPVATATPSSQTICSGGTTSIALTGSITGTTFSWTVSQTGVTGATNGTGSAITQTLTPTGLTPGSATYTITPSANGCTGTPISVVVTVDTASCTSLSAPIATGANNVTCTTMDVNWSAVTGATTYYIDVSTDPTFATFLSGYNNLNAGNVTTYTVTGVTSNTWYYYRVRASDGTYISGSSNTMVVGFSYTGLGAAATPSSQTICSGGTASIVLSSSTSGTTFSWTVSQTDVTGATNGSGATIAQTLTSTGLNPGSAIYTITPYNSGCTGAPIYDTITVDTAACPSVTAPVADSASNVTCTSFNANWSAVSGATTYYLDVSTSASFNSFVAGYNNLNVGNAITFNVTGLTANVTYYYRLRASDGTITSLNSNTISVMTCTTGISEANDQAELYVYPNPAKDKLVVRVKMNKDTRTSVVITDMLGKAVKEIKTNELQTEINVSDIPEGIYFVKLTQGNINKVQRIIISR